MCIFPLRPTSSVALTLALPCWEMGGVMDNQLSSLKTLACGQSPAPAVLPSALSIVADILRAASWRLQPWWRPDMWPAGRSPAWRWRCGKVKPSRCVTCPASLLICPLVWRMLPKIFYSHILEELVLLTLVSSLWPLILTNSFSDWRLQDSLQQICPCRHFHCKHFPLFSAGCLFVTSEAVLVGDFAHDCRYQHF